ncbi:MAG TPA: DUF2892 domain-containing protein [Devosia sp.]|nr:DUF2892 domain-containing protein [Devosia sp.]
MFKNNMGTLDRILRLVLGAVLVGVFFMFPDAGWRWLALIGIVPLATAIIGSCPIYSIFGLSTCTVKKS